MNQEERVIQNDPIDDSNEKGQAAEALTKSAFLLTDHSNVAARALHYVL